MIFCYSRLDASKCAFLSLFAPPRLLLQPKNNINWHSSQRAQKSPPQKAKGRVFIGAGGVTRTRDLRIYGQKYSRLSRRSPSKFSLFLPFADSLHPPPAGVVASANALPFFSPFPKKQTTLLGGFLYWSWWRDSNT